MKKTFLGLPDKKNCSYLLFPGCGLCEYEPSIVVKLYDSIRFQKSDAGVLMGCCGEDLKLDEIWKNFGMPTIVTTCPKCLKTFRDAYPEIPIISVYELLVDLGIGGGCNSVGYNILNPSKEYYDAKSVAAVKTLAEDMGVKIQEETASDMALPDSDFPYITQGIHIRNNLIEKGENAAHILELVYGMGELNTHLAHEHSDDHHDHDDSLDPPPAKPMAVSMLGSEVLAANRDELIDVLSQLYGF